MHHARRMTSSVLVAQKFGKDHRNVLQSIRNILLTAENSAVNVTFIASTYLNERNQSQPMFLMDRDAFALVVVSFTGGEALIPCLIQ